MTPPSSSNAYEVEQCDRDAAADLARSGAPGLGNGNRVVASEIKGGLHDDYHLVQALAKHRHEQTSAFRSQIEKVRDGYKSQMKFCDIEAMGYFREFVRRIDAALDAAS